MNGNISKLLNGVAGCRNNGEALQLLRTAVKALEEEMWVDAENAAISERHAKQALAGVDPVLLNFPR
ncbi:MAG: hypothetical protein UX10_C0039G0006 [Candidatus Magasanikbacteria bacterium GW2011_GWA2_45_39]|uniref:Uncharacterized protein n=2 Tax=Parcubacteria group TaxID=1794811 RepID=A0A0G1QBW5_9BACT|nr:MAG: hypothetical protein UX10_C0039G0006 [Candidatus Magasanikbacteria bacterium GW2011_GWA2_45_39]OGY98818.1 MAG: hypothetical protein A3B13_03110 [Candidatus Liptonbacteria bacterium RIFCSPLOWO2_01_FULL_45_15]